MNFNAHFNVKAGDHAFLGASSHSWLNYTPEKLLQVFAARQAIARGTRLHSLAAEMIKNGVNFGLRNTKASFKRYVDDCIRYRMSTETVLYYSENCFGTADAISFDGKKLRIFDLKTGANPASMKQLLIYAAIFCLEYNIKPAEIEIELRIYQNDEVNEFHPKSEDLIPIMDKIKTFDKLLYEHKEDF